MRIFARHDTFLIGGLAVALLVVSSRQLGALLDRAGEIDHSSGLQLVPALIILAAVLVIHQFRKREEMRMEANQAASRVQEMERLVAFGQALTHALDSESIRAVTTAHLALLTSGRPGWVLVRSRSGWSPLTPIDGNALSEIEHAAGFAVGDRGVSSVLSNNDVCFPLVVAGEALGVIGVAPLPALSDAQRSVLSAAAALLAASVKNAELCLEVRENSVHDSLTGCFNRRHSMDVMDAELRRSRRSHAPFSVVMFDLDRFKDINDRYGHLCGDAVLEQIGRRLKAVLRSSDTRCRYGGEEFLLLLPDTPMSGARKVAEMLRRDFEDHPLAWKNQFIPVTASFGVTDVVAGEADTQTIIRRAETALHHAKQDGRNCICISDLHESVA